MFSVLSDGKVLLDNDNTPFSIKLVLTNANNNNNKFYNLNWDGNHCTALYGRVGARATEVDIGSLRDMERQANKKIAKGYRVVDTISTSVEVVHKPLVEVAKRDLVAEDDQNKDVLFSLISYLVAQNKHKIAEFSGGRITVDEDGLVKTELGVVTQKSIDEARAILQEMWDLHPLLNNGENLSYSMNFDSDEVGRFLTLVNEYLMRIPQRVGSSRGWWVDMFCKKSDLTRQFDFLDQLSTSITLFESNQQSNKDDTANIEEHEQVFDRQIRLVTDQKVIDEIQKMFADTANRSHSSYGLRLKHVYELVSDNQAFKKKAKKIGNVKRLWHGTRNFNVLSIIKNGLLLPKSNNGLNMNITGAMFGDGVYFSNQSTKSLNYSNGYWGGASQNHCFMFVADVAMGKEFYAAHKNAESTAKGSPVYPVKGFDSVYARGGRRNLTHGGYMSNLSNDEMIVFDLNQIDLRYLCEFE